MAHLLTLALLICLASAHADTLLTLAGLHAQLLPDGGIAALGARYTLRKPYINSKFDPDVPLTRDEDGVYHCGALTARLLDHNFATVEHGSVRPGYAQKSTRQ